MGLADEYRRQFAWRDWHPAFAALPPLRGSTVFDLGCGPGDLARELARRGARVLGFDGNDELLAAAHAARVPNAEFRAADLRHLPDPGVRADGIWCSFTAAYFCDFDAVLANWLRWLRPGGFVVLVEIDDLFAHAPVEVRTRQLLDAYVADAFAAARYDFCMGRRLAAAMQRCGLEVERRIALPDRELAFDGPAGLDVLAAWRLRLDRMQLLHAHCGADWPAVRSDFLRCLAGADHRSAATVCCCIASKR